MPPLTSRISVVFLYVKDLERAKAFYRDVFGLELAGDADWQEAQLDGTRFALHAWHDGAPEPAPSDAGANVGEISRQPYGAFCDFTDPEGYTLQLFQPAS